MVFPQDAVLRGESYKILSGNIVSMYPRVSVVHLCISGTCTEFEIMFLRAYSASIYQGFRPLHTRSPGGEIFAKMGPYLVLFCGISGISMLLGTLFSISRGVYGIPHSLSTL